MQEVQVNLTSVFQNHPLVLRPSRMCLTDRRGHPNGVPSTIAKLSAPFADVPHSSYVISVHVCQLLNLTYLSRGTTGLQHNMQLLHSSAHFKCCVLTVNTVIDLNSQAVEARVFSISASCR